MHLKGRDRQVSETEHVFYDLLFSRTGYPLYYTEPGGVVPTQQTTTFPQEVEMPYCIGDTSTSPQPLLAF